MSLRLSFQKIFSLNNNLIISTDQLWRKKFFTVSLPRINQSNKVHTSAVQRDLMEFFDDETNWGEREVRVGRSWRVEELRIKSNSDLHKLWYVLLKERNMLLTMEHEYKQNFVAFPNPERIDKVEESMENLEKVVRERNRAYYLLETGETGERPIIEEVNCFGLPYKYKMKEHSIEKKYNKKFKELDRLYNVSDDYNYVKEFLLKLEEKKQNRANAIKRKKFKLVCELLKRFPNVDVEALKKSFPDIDIDEARKDPKSRTHGINAF